jgi:hypothetical protein
MKKLFSNSPDSSTSASKKQGFCKNNLRGTSQQLPTQEENHDWIRVEGMVRGNAYEEEAEKIDSAVYELIESILRPVTL